MKLVFTLYKYFPFGGLQKDMLAIANECLSRGHKVSIFCRSWTGDIPHKPGLEINVLPIRAMSNHGKNGRFARQFVNSIERIKPDIVVGFNKIPGVDIYYAADTSFKAKLYRERPWVYRYLPRYRQYLREEEQLFGSHSDTHILAISKKTIEEYRAHYQTPENRFTLLPPGISRDRINANGERLYLLHKELELTEDKLIVLMIGSGFRTKGLDRAINALVALPPDIRSNTHLVVIGEDKKDIFLQQALQHGIDEQLHFLGGRSDVPLLLRSADVLIHPAYRENTGTVLLEAAVACLPVIVTSVCGYAHYIADHDLGMVLPEPLDQKQLNTALLLALSDGDRIKQWRNNGMHFSRSADIYNMPQKAASAIEHLAKEKIH